MTFYVCLSTSPRSSPSNPCHGLRGFLRGLGLVVLGAAYVLVSGCNQSVGGPCKKDADCGLVPWRCAQGSCLYDPEGWKSEISKEGVSEGDAGPKVCSTGERRSCYTGPKGTLNVGICRDGEQLCVSGVWGECLGQFVPENELCDNLDNDCDGKVDEICNTCVSGQTRPCYAGPEGTQGKGACKAGVQTCQQATKTWGVCVGQVLPKAELCNQIDDDCNGKVDDGCAQCIAGQQEGCILPAAASGCASPKPGEIVCLGECRAGQRSCQPGGVWGPCQGGVAPRTEICDGKDNDCDGKVDEDIPSAPLCEHQSGLCAGAKKRCGGAAGWLICVTADYGRNNAAYEPNQETSCDGKDNDCDGLVDETCANTCQVGQTQACYTGSPSTQGKGPCKAGTQTCQQATKTWGTCVGQVLPKAETCNGIDDNCDGKIDETFPEQGSLCQTGLLGICAQGSRTCVAGKLTCTAFEQARAEICNGLDDDCDGKIDEGASTFTFYPDDDKDSYGDPSRPLPACRPPAGYVTDKTDCYDKNPDVFPGQGQFFTKQRGDGKFDYNCNGIEERRFTQIGSCKGCTTPLFDQGFVGSIPACGQVGQWVDACRFDVGKCSPVTIQKVQECR